MDEARAGWGADGEGWEAAFAALPRALFLPDLIWPHDVASRTASPVHRAEDAAGWRRAADADVPVVTQWDEGAHAGTAPGAAATSSASMPSVVAAMLAALRVEEGMRVLEIGTGTGWTAALLAHRLGARNVTSVEIDPRVAAAARRSLRAVGLRPRVLTGDGAAGAPEGAPYDRLIATCGLRHVPPAWLKQVRPGGEVLVPWGTDYSHRDALVRLTVGADGAASGPFLRLVEFMKLRAQRFTWPTYPRDLPVADATDTAPEPPHGQWHPFPFVAGLRVRGAAFAVQRHEDGHTQWLYSLTDPSWTAAVRRARTGPHTVVRRVGHRRLWDELRAAHRWWLERGSPDVTRFGLTVTPAGERAWLDGPQRPVAG